MTHDPTYFKSKGSCIYCGAMDVRLTNEHIVPYSLGGSHVIREASCVACAKITAKFERSVARGLWGDARTAFDAPTRRKRERKRHIVIPDLDNHKRSLKIPAGEYSAGLMFYKMPQAGLLQGMPEVVDLSNSWTMVVIDDDKRRQEFLKKHPKKLAIRFQHVPEAFGRLLVKIGYGQVLTELDPGDFRPICLPYITGKKENVSYVVGGTLEEQVPEPEIGYSLGSTAFGNSHKLMLIALIRLYANTHSPAYHVVVGDVEGPENVERIVQKLGTPIIKVGYWQNSASQPAAHWLPRNLPLPFWVNDSSF